MLITLAVPPCRIFVWSAARSACLSFGFMTVGVSPRSRWPSSSKDTCPSRKSGTPFVSVTVCIVRFAPLDRRRRRWRRRGDVDAEHAVDALALVGGVGLQLGFGVVGESTHSKTSTGSPRRRRRRRCRCRSRRRRACRGCRVSRVPRLAPDVVALVGVYLLAVLFEVRVYGHWYTVAGSPHTLKSTREIRDTPCRRSARATRRGELQK